MRLGAQHQWELINENLIDDPYQIIGDKIDLNNPSIPCKIHPLARKKTG